MNQRGQVAVIGAVLAVLLAAASCSNGAETTASGPVGSAAPGTALAPATTNGSSPGPGSSAPAAAPSSVPAKPSAGCQGATAPGLTPGTAADLTIEVDGKSHPYRAYVPPESASGTPVPLVLDLHGLTQTRQSQAMVSGWEQLAQREHLVVLTPQGGDKVPNWSATPADDNPDTVWLEALIDKIGRDTCIDQTRVYAGGISNGGLESSILSCKLPDKLAAVGLVAGIVVPEQCKTAPPKPAIVFWGKRDCVLPFYGGLGPCLMGPKTATVPASRPPADIAGVPPVEDTVAAWAGRNGCAPAPAATRVAEHVEKITYTGCRQDAAVELYVISNGGHTWPGSKPAATRDKDPDAPNGITTMEVDATTLMWAFFQRFQITG